MPDETGLGNAESPVVKVHDGAVDRCNRPFGDGQKAKETSASQPVRGRSPSATSKASSSPISGPSSSIFNPSYFNLLCERSEQSLDWFRFKGKCSHWLFSQLPQKRLTRWTNYGLNEKIALAWLAMEARGGFEALLDVALSDREAERPQTMIQNLLKRLNGLEGDRVLYLAGVVYKPETRQRPQRNPHVHLILNVRPGTARWTEMESWVQKQNADWTGRAKLKAAIDEKGGLPGKVYYIAGPKNLGNANWDSDLRMSSELKDHAAVLAASPRESAPVWTVEDQAELDWFIEQAGAGSVAIEMQDGIGKQNTVRVNPPVTTPASSRTQAKFDDGSVFDGIDITGAQNIPNDEDSVFAGLHLDGIASKSS